MILYDFKNFVLINKLSFFIYFILKIKINILFKIYIIDYKNKLNNYKIFIFIKKIYILKIKKL